MLQLSQLPEEPGRMSTFEDLMYRLREERGILGTPGAFFRELAAHTRRDTSTLRPAVNRALAAKLIAVYYVQPTTRRGRGQRSDEMPLYWRIFAITLRDEDLGGTDIRGLVGPNHRIRRVTE